eukprot:scaffold12306_cov147-Isochrysis_galbana.AAC.4
MSASLSTSLRADYGGALTRCVAIFGRTDQHSAGAEGAPYRLKIDIYGECFIVRRWKECEYMERVPSASRLNRGPMSRCHSWSTKRPAHQSKSKAASATGRHWDKENASGWPLGGRIQAWATPTGDGVKARPGWRLNPMPQPLPSLPHPAAPLS